MCRIYRVDNILLFLILSISNLMKYSLEHMQLEVGWDKPIFTSSYSKFLVWIKLQVIFMYNLLENRCNRIKEYFILEWWDQFFTSTYNWLFVQPTRIATKTWIQFLNTISNQNNILSSPVNTSLHISNHRESIVSITEDQSIILLDNNRIQQYCKTIKERSKLKFERQIEKHDNKAFLPYQCDIKNNFLIISPPHTITLSLDQIKCQSTEAWIKEYMKIDFPAIIEAINFNKVVFSVDRSFFSERSSLISTHITIIA